MNAENVSVNVLKKRFEDFQNSKISVQSLEDKRHEIHVNKRNIKRTPAFRRDVNNSRKYVDHSQALTVTNNEKKFNYNNLTNTCNKTLKEHLSYKTDNLNKKKSLNSFVKDNKNTFIADQKVLIQSLKKKLENKSSKPKISKKNIEHTLKKSLPIGPPPKKPPRTFTHDRQIDSDITKKYKMESQQNSKSDPKVMLQKLEKFVMDNSHTYGVKDENIEQELSSKKYSKKSNLFNLAKSLNCSESKNVYDNSLKIYHTDEQNYLTTKSYYGSDNEHIYDEPMILKSNSRLNINVDNCHVPINNEWVCDSDKSNLHYMSTPIKDYNSVKNLKKSESCSKSDITDELDSKINKNLTISHEKKIQMLMNEAYGTFIKTLEESDSESASNNEDSSSGSISNLTDKKISEQTLERKGYLQRVSKKVISKCPNIVQDKNNLFRALLLIGLDLSSTKEKLPYIKYKYPEQVEIPKQIENLCFPDAHVWPFTADDCRTYSLTVTDENGRRYYGYCYRVQPEGAAYCLPLVYCIYSSIKANSFYFKILQEIESRHGLSEFNMKTFIELLYNQSFPELGSAIYIPQESKNFIVEISTNEGELRRPFDIRQEQDDLLKLLHIIKPNSFIQMLATMLLERKLILLSKSISLLSSSIEGLTSSLYPFTWQHTLVSVLPSQMVSVADFIQAPTPYIIGLLKTEDQSDIFSQLSANDHVFIFDLDTNKAIRKVKDEYSVIPSRIAKGLKSVIGLKVELDQSTKAALASESLIRLFVELVGHYRTFIMSNSENKYYYFQKQFFINAGINTAHRNFLEWFTETAMFTTFINNKMNNSIDNKDVFERRCAEFSLELCKIKHKSKTLQSMKALGDRIKDWAVS